jgi:hypothetical protein
MKELKLQDRFASTGATLTPFILVSATATVLLATFKYHFNYLVAKTPLFAN